MAQTCPKKAAIIGSGPAGMAAANILRNASFEVTVFDELPEFGGMLAYGIPECRIPLATVRQKNELARSKGIALVKKKITSIKKLLKEFDFVLLAIGSGFGAKAGTPGEENKSTIDALQFLLEDKLENRHMLFKGEKVAVIGGGNAAIDSARVAAMQGAEVTIIYRRTEDEMPAYREEIEQAKKEGIKFEFLKCPSHYMQGKKITLICSEMALSVPDDSGRRRPIETGNSCDYVFDKILLAVGQQPDFGWLSNEGIANNGKIVKVDPDFRTSIERVYAAGDCVTGPRTIAEAARTGIAAAQAMLRTAGSKDNKTWQ